MNQLSSWLFNADKTDLVEMYQYCGTIKDACSLRIEQIIGIQDTRDATSNLWRLLVDRAKGATFTNSTGQGERSCRLETPTNDVLHRRVFGMHIQYHLPWPIRVAAANELAAGYNHRPTTSPGHKHKRTYVAGELVDCGIQQIDENDVTRDP